VTDAVAARGTVLGRVVAPWVSVWRAWVVRRVLLALIGSQGGAWLYIIAVSVYAYQQGGAVWVGLVQLARSVASAVASPIGGVVADRYPRRWVIVPDVAGGPRSGAHASPHRRSPLESRR
jgi:MFS family permease